MKKILIFMLAVLSFGLVLFSPVAYADSTNFNIVFSGSEVTENDIEKDIIDFVYGEGASVYDDSGLRVDRTAGTDGEYRARDYIETYLKGIYGISAEKDSTADGLFGVVKQEVTYQTSITAQARTSYNVIAIQKSNNDTTDYVVVGAHYDNFYGYATSLYGSGASKSHGIYDNASGVASLMNVIKLMKDKNLPFDVYYVFFGAEECGNYGAEGFYQGFVKKYVGDMKLMINLDSIGNGDNLYMYADEVKTLHESYYGNLNSKLTTSYDFCETIKTAPKNKKVNYMTSSGSVGYSHMGLASDNNQFIGKGNNVITFFSGAWDDANAIGITESSKNDNLMHTNNDSLDKVKELYGDVFFRRIKQVTYLVANSLVQDDFLSMLNESSKTSGNYVFFTNSLYANLIFAALLTVGLVIFLLCIKKYKITANVESLQKLREAVLDNNIDVIADSPNKKFTDKIEKEIIIEDDDKK